MRPRPPLVFSLAVAVAALAAGCGGGHSPGVAKLASPPPAGTTTTTQAESGPSVKPFAGPAGPHAQFKLGMNVGTKDGTKFSQCMRKHGVTNFPDPDGQGVITIQSSMGIDPGSPTFTAARTACEKLLPNGGQPTPAQIAQHQQELLQFSSCMRSHGLKDFPDPSNGGLRVSVHPGSDLDPASPTFQKAMKACQKDLPFKAFGAKGG
jgi:hypothetical protein